MRCPTAARIEHVRDNHAALDLELSAEEHAALDAYFRPPCTRQRLDML
ncbi:hypothetical protein ACFPTO_07825 [Paraburkholderia denitrificans]|uniref:Aldo/keto reductase n=1 Tax=Paraburkholderia denitrificans TaxID=694025 RepID=A0ABW0J6L9_9BURK